MLQRFVADDADQPNFRDQLQFKKKLGFKFQRHTSHNRLLLKGQKTKQNKVAELFTPDLRPVSLKWPFHFQK